MSRLRTFRYLADQNVPRTVVTLLREAGLDILSVRDVGLLGAFDDVILRAAVADRRVVLTHDRDFGQLAIQAKLPVFGILYVRPGHGLPASTAAAVVTALADPLEVEPPFIVVVSYAGSRTSLRSRPLD